MDGDGFYDVTAISFHAYPYIQERYALLSSGGSVGEGYGPMVVSTRTLTPEQARGVTIAVPGKLTTAYLLLACRFVAAQGLTVAAASDLQSALPAIAAQFEKDTGHQVSLIFGSSGNFFTQIQNGAPFDVLLSADIDYPRRLEGSGQAERGSLSEYATGRLVLWTRSDSGIDVRRGLTVLTDVHVRRVTIANPEHAP